MSLIRSMQLILGLKCRDASRFIAESADRGLTWDERWALRVHLVTCDPCRRFKKQLRILSQIISRFGERLISGELLIDEELSDSARQRLDQMVEKHFPKS